MEDFPGDVPSEFFWALFPTEMRRKNPARKSAKKSGGSKRKIREKSVLPKAGPKTSRKEPQEFAQTVCANCFYLGGWFFLGGSPSLDYFQNVRKKSRESPQTCDSQFSAPPKRDSQKAGSVREP